jgi:hypothetical protein
MLTVMKSGNSSRVSSSSTSFLELGAPGSSVTAPKTIVGPQQRFEIHGVRLSRHIAPHGVAILADFVASGVITLPVMAAGFCAGRT